LSFGSRLISVLLTLVQTECAPNTLAITASESERIGSDQAIVTSTSQGA
jgi:hypothetical protein